jgi:hypothetical protein
MEAIQPDTAGAPLELVTTLQAFIKGLRYVELLQLQGPKSYQGIGCQWSLKCNDAPTGEDEVPDDSIEEIIRTVWLAATNYHKANHGDQRFTIKVHRVCAGKMKIDDVKFSVSPADQGTSDASSTPQETAKADLIQSIVNYMKEIHGINIRERDGFVKVIEASAERDLRTTATMQAMMESAMHLRMDAFTDRAEAIFENMGEKKKGVTSGMEGQWATAKSTFDSIIHSPIGAAFAAKAFGLSPEELETLLGKEEPKKEEPKPKDVEIIDLRPLCAELGKSITSKQQATLATILGTPLGMKLLTLEKASSAEEGRRLVLEVFDAIDKAGKWVAVENALSQAQRKIVEKIFLALNPS